MHPSRLFISGILAGYPATLNSPIAGRCRRLSICNHSIGSTSELYIYWCFVITSSKFLFRFCSHQVSSSSGSVHFNKFLLRSFSDSSSRWIEALSTPDGPKTELNKVMNHILKYPQLMEPVVLY